MATIESRKFATACRVFLLAALMACSSLAAPTVPGPNQRPTPAIQFQTNDVIAFIGGADVAAAQHHGHLETLLLLAYPKHQLRFRNFGWEGDTVYAQPRDVGYPPLTHHLTNAHVTMAFVQFGRAEALQGQTNLPKFIEAYGHLLATLKPLGLRTVLVLPPAYESGTGLRPDLSHRNADLQAYANAIEKMALGHGYPIINLLQPSKQKLTDDGLQLTPRGQAHLAIRYMEQLQSKVASPGEPDRDGAWPHAKIETLRREVVEKNRLWFDYYRPQNWAFLGGDRVTQPSSRDHLDPKVRWFPAEMERFVPLIEKSESRITDLATQAAPSPK